MKLIVDELHDSLYQTVRRSKNTILTAVRPHIYRHLWPTGSIRAVVKDSVGTTVATGTWVSISEIGTADYFHGYVRLYVNAYLAADTDYRIAIEVDGTYVFDNNAYVGVCNGYDLGRYPATYSTGESGYLDPLDIELWERNA